MCSSGQQAKRQRGKRGQNGLDEGLAAWLVLWGGAVDAVEQFRSRDSGYCNLFGRAQLLF